MESIEDGSENTPEDDEPVCRLAGDGGGGGDLMGGGGNLTGGGGFNTFGGGGGGVGKTLDEVLTGGPVGNGTGSP